MVIADGPGAGTECDLEERMTIKQHDDRDEEAKRKRVMGHCFVRLVEGVRLGEFGLMVLETLLLPGREHTSFSFVDFGELFFVHRRCFDISVCWDWREVANIVQLWQGSFSAQPPRQMMIMRDEAHVIRVHGTERSQAITNHGEQSNQDVVYNIGVVALSTTDADPTYKEQYPDEAKNGN